MRVYHCHFFGLHLAGFAIQTYFLWESCVGLFETPQVLLVHILTFVCSFFNVSHCITVTFCFNASLNSCLPFCVVI